MKNFVKKVSALVLTTMFASMQISWASIDTGLGNGLGGAVIDKIDGGFAGINKGNGSADLNFSGDAHVNWGSLNVNKGESLNFNAVGGSNNLTILNTVNNGMSTIYGQINANSGIGKLIISNPNGVLFDGAKFTTAGDVMVTTQPMTATFIDGKMDVSKVATSLPVGVINIQDSDFSVGGEFNILAPSINVVQSAINTQNGLKLITANGQDYLSTGNIDVKDAVRLEAVNIDGDVYIIADKGVVKTVSGGKINGNLDIKSNDSVALNYVSNGKALEITGDANVKGNGVLMYARNTKVGGNLKMENGGGFLEVGNVQVGKNMELKTTKESENPQGYKHFVHVIGDNNVGGNLIINSENNIHIGGYDIDAGKLQDGSLTVGGAIDAYANNGTIAVTIDTVADSIKLKSENLNIITDGKALITANKYDFSAKGYIGGLKSTENSTVDEQIICTMETYKLLNNPSSHTNMNIAGGTITNVATEAFAYISSNGDLKVTGANANKLYLTAPDKFIEITGNGVHADTITVGNETDKLKVDFASRDYTLKYTNIRDAKEVTINGNDEITYELTNGENGYNISENRQEDTTYLVGPEKPVDPEEPTIDPEDNENAKVLRSYERHSVDMSQVYTPVAYAADLDDDQIDRGVRKNVDGSVTVVKAFAVGK